jgi:hypothetical protein
MRFVLLAVFLITVIIFCCNRLNISPIRQKISQCGSGITDSGLIHAGSGIVDSGSSMDLSGTSAGTTENFDAPVCIGYSEGCPRTNRSRPITQRFYRGWSAISTDGPEISPVIARQLLPFKSEDEIICAQHKELEELKKGVTAFHDARRRALEAGQTQFLTPLSEYTPPLTDPTRRADQQPVSLGISPEQLTSGGQCTLDALNNVVCNPKLWQASVKSGAGTAGVVYSIEKSVENFMNRLTTEPQFNLFHNNKGPQA